MTANQNPTPPDQADKKKNAEPKGGPLGTPVRAPVIKPSQKRKART
jgi:hypothetical protein